MGIFKRAITCNIRHIQKTMLLFFVIFLLAVLIAIAIAIFQGIVNIDVNLRKRLPPITSIVFDSGIILSKDT